MSKRSAMDIDAVSDEIGIGVLSQDLLSSKSSPKHGTQNETLEDGNDQPSAERIEASDSKVSLFFFFFYILILDYHFFAPFWFLASKKISRGRVNSDFNVYRR